MGNLRRFVVDGLVALALGYVIKKLIFPLLEKLAENAMLGWMDDKIGDAIGLTAQNAINWFVAFGLAAVILWLYHVLQVRFFQKPSVAIYTIGNPQDAVRENIISQIPRRLYDEGNHAAVFLGSRVILAWILIIGCSVGLIAGLLILIVESPKPRVIDLGTFSEKIPQSFPDDGGPIKWDKGFFLSASGGGSDGMQIGGVQITGQNESDEFVGPLSGFIRSETTGQQFPFVFRDNGRDVPLDGLGIPARNQFHIFAPFASPLTTGEFLRDFSRLTFVFRYGTHTYTKRFTPDEIQREIDRTHAFLIPHVPESRVGLRPMPSEEAK
jgi:hypothetical protein